MTFDSRLGCSSISFRHLPLAQALETIDGLGFAEIDLGALPGVCDHVPYELSEPAVADVVATLGASRLVVRSVNGDIGDLNAELDPDARAARARHLRMLLTLARDAGATALVLPCGAQSHAPLVDLDTDLDRVAVELNEASQVAAQYGPQLWVELLHFYRLSWNTEIAAQLEKRLGPEVKLVLDVSHVVASGGDPARFVELFGPRIAHVHLRDASPGYINHSIGNGEVDFPATIAALAAAGYPGHFSLELETRDVRNDERPAATRAAAEYIATVLGS